MALPPISDSSTTHPRFRDTRSSRHSPRSRAPVRVMGAKWGAIIGRHKGYIGPAEAFDSSGLAGIKPQSAMSGDAGDLVRIEGVISGPDNCVSARCCITAWTVTRRHVRPPRGRGVAGSPTRAMLSTGTPFADRTDTKVCLISRGTQSSPRPAFFVMIQNARITLFAVRGVPIRDAKTRPWSRVRRPSAGPWPEVRDAAAAPRRIAAPDPLPVRPVAERDRTHVPVLRCSEVDRVLAVPTATICGLGRGWSLTLWLPATPSGDLTSL
jgi:hypothetical protein